MNRCVSVNKQYPKFKAIIILMKGLKLFGFKHETIASNAANRIGNVAKNLSAVTGIPMNSLFGIRTKNRMAHESIAPIPSKRKSFFGERMNRVMSCFIYERVTCFTPSICSNLKIRSSNCSVS